MTKEEQAIVYGEQLQRRIGKHVRVYLHCFGAFVRIEGQLKEYPNTKGYGISSGDCALVFSPIAIASTSDKSWVSFEITINSTL